MFDRFIRTKPIELFSLKSPDVKPPSPEYPFYSDKSIVQNEAGIILIPMEENISGHKPL
jgi:hypothetical protein